MKCIEVKESLDALIDGEIGFSEKEKTELHLENCDSCKTEFKNLQAISKTMKKALPNVAPMSLDAKIFDAFENQHVEKQTEDNVEEKAAIGWFGIPKLAFATAFLLLALFSGFAFQLGRMSVDKMIVSQSANVESKQEKNSNEQSDTKPFEELASTENDEQKKIETKIIEVPVIKEKIVKVPVIKEKIVTRTVYVNKNQKRLRKISQDISKQNKLALNNSVKDGEFLTQTNLKDFQPVSEIKPKISKEK